MYLYMRAYVYLRYLFDSRVRRCAMPSPNYKYAHVCMFELEFIITVHSNHARACSRTYANSMNVDQSCYHACTRKRVRAQFNVYPYAHTHVYTFARV